MLIPKGRGVFENLNTSFTNLNELIVELKEERHTGYVAVSYWDYQGVLFFDGGKVINAIEEQDGRRTAGADAVSNVIEKVHEKDGTISVYQLPPETVTLLASTTNSKARHKDLSSEFTSLPRLIEKLREEAHSGYIEVDMQDSEDAGMIFLQSGDPVTSMLSLNGETSLGTHVLAEIVSVASQRGAMFNVYEVDLEASISESAEVMAGFELPRLLEVWGEIFAGAERVIGRLNPPESFQNTLKDVCILLSEDYPFLDPFAAEFEYRDGSISVRNVSVRQVNSGLSAGLMKTLEAAGRALPGVDLIEEMKAELAILKDSSSEELAKFELPSALPALLG